MYPFRVASRHTKVELKHFILSQVTLATNHGTFCCCRPVSTWRSLCLARGGGKGLPTWPRGRHRRGFCRCVCVWYAFERVCYVNTATNLPSKLACGFRVRYVFRVEDPCPLLFSLSLSLFLSLSLCLSLSVSLSQPTPIDQPNRSSQSSPSTVVPYHTTPYHTKTQMLDTRDYRMVSSTQVEGGLVHTHEYISGEEMNRAI